MSALTVRQALNLPIFASARLVAGESGLDNLIHWVHIVDMTHAHYQWERKGVLLLTTGFGFYESLEAQTSIVPRLAQLGFAGLVLSTGHYLDRMPKRICEDADRLRLPIIETPPDLLFIQITEAVLKRTVNRQYVLLQQSASIGQQLTALAIKGASLIQLATKLSSLLNRSIAIESPTFEILASARSGDLDTAWEQSLTLGRSTTEVSNYLLSTQTYSQITIASKPQLVKAQSQLGMTMDRIIAPIAIEQRRYGYIWLLSGQDPLTALDELAIEQGATVAALILVREQAVRNVENELQGDFFTQLLIANSNISGQLREQAQRFNYRFNYPHQVLLMKYIKASAMPIQSLREFVRAFIERSHSSFLLFTRDDCLILVLESKNTTLGKDLSEQMLAVLNPSECPLLIGIGTALETSETAHGGLQKSYEQAQEAAEIGICLKKAGAIAFDDLGMLHWLYHLPLEHRSSNVYLQRVRALAASDRERKTKLLETLEVYLEQGGSVANTAKALYIHRNTLLNRIKSLESLCELNLRESAHLFNLDAAIKCYRLHG